MCDWQRFLGSSFSTLNTPYTMLPSIRTVPVSEHLKQKLNFWGPQFQLSVNEVFRMKAEQFSFKMKVLGSWKLAKQSQKTSILRCSGQKLSHFIFSRGAFIYQTSSFDRRLQYVTQYPDDTSIRTLETKTQFLRRPFQFSVNEVFRMKVLAIWKLVKQSQKTPFCSGE